MTTSLLLIACGVLLLVVGADALVSGASRIAQRFGIPPLIIGLTIVAIVTSMPEIMVSATAALGGSNVFNITLCLGLAGLVAPDGLLAPAQLIEFDLRIMVLVAVALLPLIFTDYEVSRLEGVVLLLVPHLPRLDGARRHRPPDAIFGLFPAIVVFLVATVVIALRDPTHRLRH